MILSGTGFRRQKPMDLSSSMTVQGPFVDEEIIRRGYECVSADRACVGGNACKRYGQDCG